MNRRTLFGNALKTTIALSSLSIFANAAPVVPPMPVCPAPADKPQIKSEISSNHGHEFTISYEDVIRGKVQTVNIQGKSGHAHAVEITAEVLEVLRTKVIVEIESTNAGGHTHIVRIKRDLV